MPELSGMSLAGLISFKTKIIFTTSFREYAADAFEKDAADFLLKPFFYDRFLKSLQKARDRITVQKKEIRLTDLDIPTLFIKTGIKGQMRSLLVNDIIRAAAALDYVEIYLRDEKILAYLTLNDLLEKLPRQKFSRIHKSHLINHEFIQTLETSQIRLNDHDKTILPIGPTYRAAFQEKMNDLLLISKRDHPA
jgi:two-component system LytT family response regulator